MENFKNEYQLILEYLNLKNISSFSVITSSWNSNVFIINNELVFKFPKTNYGIIIAQNESKLTYSIHNLLNIKIPILDVVEYSKGFFCVYKFIEGIEYKNLSPNYIELSRENFSYDLSSFIAKLHSLNIKNFDYLEKSNFSMNEPEINLYNRYNILCDFLKNTDNFDDFKKSFDYIDNIKLFSDDFCLLHNDINEGNFLIDIKTKKINGIIDFSNTKIGNFNEEFARLSSFDFRLVSSIINKYQKITKRKVNLKYAINIQKIRYYAYICNSIENNQENYINSFLYNKIPSLKFFERMLNS